MTFGKWVGMPSNFASKLGNSRTCGMAFFRGLGATFATLQFFHECESVGESGRDVGSEEEWSATGKF